MYKNRSVDILTMVTVNLEQGMPTVEIAKSRLNQALRTAKANRTPVVKLIHGYGSSGKGGTIRWGILRELEARQQQGQIRLVIRGDEFSPFYESARRAIDLYPELRKDRDYTKTNQGITVVII